MNDDETSAYVDRMLRRRRTVRLAWTGFAVALTVGMVALLIWGDDWACHYGVSRENYSVPDLTGLRPDEASDQLLACVDLERVGAADNPDARIIRQDPEPPDLLNHRRSIQVVLESAC